jgi:hypothetical protein
MAAQKRSDIQTLPCLIFNSVGQKEEARGFFNINKLRKPISAIDTFRALLIAGDEIALFVKQICDELDIEITKNSNHAHQLKCIAIAQNLAKNNKDDFIQIMTFVNTLCGDVMAISDRLLTGISYINAHCEYGLNNKKLTTRLLEAGPVRLLEGANKASMYFNKGGPKIFAQGFLDVINKGLKIKFTLDKD